MTAVRDTPEQTEEICNDKFIPQLFTEPTNEEDIPVQVNSELNWNVTHTSDYKINTAENQAVRN